MGTIYSTLGYNGLIQLVQFSFLSFRLLIPIYHCQVHIAWPAILLDYRKSVTSWSLIIRKRETSLAEGEGGFCTCSGLMTWRSTLLPPCCRSPTMAHCLFIAFIPWLLQCNTAHVHCALVGIYGNKPNQAGK